MEDLEAAYGMAVDAARQRFGREPFVFPEFGSERMVLETDSNCRVNLRFIASSPLDFAHRVEAVVEKTGSAWSVESLEISARIHPFSRP